MTNVASRNFGWLAELCRELTPENNARLKALVDDESSEYPGELEYIPIGNGLGKLGNILKNCFAGLAKANFEPRIPVISATST
jgi:hypothetical protein